MKHSLTDQAVNSMLFIGQTIHNVKYFSTVFLLETFGVDSIDIAEHVQKCSRVVDHLLEESNLLFSTHGNL
jgi:hypothetical protein